MPELVATLSIADEIWVATALLHREYPERADFTLSEIVARAQKEGIAPEHRRGLRPHASRHCVANAAASPANHRLLFETGKSRRRLYRPGDPFHQSRRSGKTYPKRLPGTYQSLIEWYLKEWAGPGGDPLLELYGSWKRLLNGRTADEYVRELREGWE